MKHTITVQANGSVSIENRDGVVSMSRFSATAGRIFDMLGPGAWTVPDDHPAIVAAREAGLL